MANARIAHLDLDGSTDTFDVTFDYISKAHVIVKIDGSATTAFTWLTDSRIQMDSMPASGSNLIITRESSPTTRLVDYQTGSILSETVLDTDSLQAFYLAQEANDVKELVLNINDATNQWNGQNKRINNVANPTAAQDAVTKHYLENTWLSPTDKANVTALSGLTDELGRLGTADAVNDLAIVGTVDFVADLNDIAAIATDVATVADNATAVSTNATNISSINTNASNITSIQNAYTNATNAASSASAAATSAVTAASYAGTQSVDRFNGTGSQTDFTLSLTPETENNTSVYVSGIYQQKDTYSISGTTLTFSTAPPTGTGNIEVMHMSLTPTGVDPEIGTVTTGAAGSSASVTATGHVLDFTIPRGDTGATGATGPQGIQGDTGPAGSISGAADGSAAAPSISFSADTNTGVYRPGAD